MPQISSIEQKLSDEQRAQLNAIIGKGGSTLHDLMAYCEETFGVEISQTAMHRHRTKIEADAKALRESRMIVEALGKELGESASLGEQGRLLVEMVRALAFDMLRKVREEGATLSPKDIAMLGKGFAELGRSLRLDQDHETKIREQVEQEIKKEAADSAGEKMVQAGLSADQIQFWREEFLGVRKQGSEDKQE